MRNLGLKRSFMRLSISLLKREAKKAKVMLDETLEKYGLLDEQDEQAPRGGPRTRGLKRAIALERQKEARIVDHLTLNEQLAMVINENREPWLDRSNQHLEKLLVKANKDNDLLRRKAKHHAQKEKIAMAKLKRANAKVEALTMLEEKINLDILVEPSLQS